MQLFVTYIVLFVTAVKARFSDFLFSIADPIVVSIPKHTYRSNCPLKTKLTRKVAMYFDLPYVQQRQHYFRIN